MPKFRPLVLALFTLAPSAALAQEPPALWRSDGEQALTMHWKFVESRSRISPKDEASWLDRRIVKARLTPLKKFQGAGAFALEIQSLEWVIEHPHYKLTIHHRAASVPRFTKAVLDPAGAKELDEKIQEFEAFTKKSFRLRVSKTGASISIKEGSRWAGVSTSRSIFRRLRVQPNIPREGFKKSKSWTDRAALDLGFMWPLGDSEKPKLILKAAGSAKSGWTIKGSSKKKVQEKPLAGKGLIKGMNSIKESARFHKDGYLSKGSLSIRSATKETGTFPKKTSVSIDHALTFKPSS